MPPRVFLITGTSTGFGDLKTGGVIRVPSFSIYCASKWVVEGFTETVSKEVKPEWSNSTDVD
ncbi:hypothetical protein P171DRAFT_480148 [Karstenula rhodostoma CBS 690.94]|uniref:Uncharacterized protein n=1 Tax=Karstenula rhodostoma CBS 690.94 TaxID=1392251 RepID=A0A9P4PVQ9_9PLEO|nr:hypothetical protein P171DRAFT_480148 [Karstenula rhodostoma CBS 690.94]